VPDFRLKPVPSTDVINLDWWQQPITGLIDETNDLKSAIVVALCSDALADTADALPDPNSDDRRGWWGDLDADTIWGGWPLGSKLWLLTRAKITDSAAREGATVTRVQTYIALAIQPFVTNHIISTYALDVQQTTYEQIIATLTLYRGPRTMIQMQFQTVWDELNPAIS
jgi:phage gp46-like protein